MPGGGALDDLSRRGLIVLLRQGPQAVVSTTPPAPNAPGAAKSLAEASDALIDDMLNWAAASVK